MQKTIRSTTTGILLLLALAGLLATTPLAMAQSTNGPFNPQTQFPIGSTITVNSVYGLGGGMPFFNPGMKGRQIHGWAQKNPSQARNWNQTGPPPQSFTASLTLTAQVTNDTANGDILWTIKSGSINENGTTLTITRGMGGIGKLDRILMVGNVTDSNGHTYGWSLEGFAAMYNGTVIASLNGASSYNPATPTTQQPSIDKRPRGVPLSFIATIT
jgi:hypothetical protein